jgi:hypothetical protein
MPAAQAVLALGALASERFPAATATIAAFASELGRAAEAADRRAFVDLLVRFEDYLEALLVAPPARSSVPRDR